MEDINIINEGRKDLINPLNENEMNYIIGGNDSDMDASATCKKGYTSAECKCGYSGPAFPSTILVDADEL